MGSSERKNYPSGWDSSDPKEVFGEFLDRYKKKYGWKEEADIVNQFSKVLAQASQDKDLLPYLAYFNRFSPQKSSQPKTRNLPAKEDTSKSVYFSGENRLPQLNPLMQAEIAERLQFDGDAPELRSRVADPKKLTPAVPVLTESMNLSQIALELEKASEQTKQLMKSNLEEFEENTQALDVLRMTSRQLSKVIDPDHYKTGKPAKMVKAPSVSGVATSKQITKTIHSTQGRTTISSLFQKKLKTWLEEQKKCKVRVKSLSKNEIKKILRNPEESVEIFADWEFKMIPNSGLNENFSFLENALAVLKKKLEPVPENTKISFSFVDATNLPKRKFHLVALVWQESE